MRNFRVRKVLPILLALALCLTLLPVPAGAEEESWTETSGEIAGPDGGQDETGFYALASLRPGQPALLTARRAPDRVIPVRESASFYCGSGNGNSYTWWMDPDGYEKIGWLVEAVGEPCTVTFVPGGETAPVTRAAYVEGTVATPEGIVRAGFVLDGWFTDAACTRPYDFASPVTANLTLYAGWERNEYTVEFVNSIPTGEFTSKNTVWRTVTVSHGDTVEEPAPPSGGLNLFTGWSDGSRIYDFSRPVMENLTLRTERIPFDWKNYGGVLRENSNISWELDSSDCVLSLTGEGATGGYICDHVYPQTFPDWYGQRLKIGAIEVGEGIDGVGGNAFSWCCNAVRASLPEGLESVGEYAFRGCERLENAVLEEGVETIVQFAFDGCVRPQTVVLPGSVKEIGEWAFDTGSVRDGPVHIFYAGSRGQWEAVNIHPNNNLDGAVLHYNCPESGELETVFFNSRGGFPVEDQLRLEGELLEEPLAPERADYTFTGWYRDDGASFFWTPPGGLWESVWF